MKNPFRAVKDFFVEPSYGEVMEEEDREREKGEAKNIAKVKKLNQEQRRALLEKLLATPYPDDYEEASLKHDLTLRIVPELDAERSKDLLLSIIQRPVDFDLQAKALIKLQELDPSVWLPLHLKIYSERMPLSLDSDTPVLEHMVESLAAHDVNKYQDIFFKFAKNGVSNALRYLMKPEFLQQIALSEAVSSKLRLDAAKKFNAISERKDPSYRQHATSSEKVDLEPIYVRIVKELTKKSYTQFGDREQEAISGLNRSIESNRQLIVEYLLRKFKELQDAKNDPVVTEKIQYAIKRLYGQEDTMQNLETLLERCPEPDLCKLIELELRLRR